MAVELEKLVSATGQNAPSDEETVQAIFTLVRRLVSRPEGIVSESTQMPDPWLTLSAGAEYASVSEDTLREWISSGLLKAGRVGRVIRIRRSEIDALLSGKNERSETSSALTAKSSSREIVSGTSQSILTSLRRGKSASRP